MTKLFGWLIAVCLLAACGAAGPSAEQRRLDRTYDFAKTNLLAVGSNELASVAYLDSLDLGATPVSYLVASAPDDGDFVRLLWNEPPQPWSVRLAAGPGPNQIVLAAFAESTGTPVREETLTVKPLEPH